MYSDQIEATESLACALTQVIPFPLMVVTHDMTAVHLNPAAKALVDRQQSVLVKKRCGEIFECLHALQHPDGCGHSSHCNDCVLRQAVLSVQQESGIFRQQATVHCTNGSSLHLLVTATEVLNQGNKLVVLILEEFNALVKELGMLPICAACHKIRGRDNHWYKPSDYFNEHLQIEFTHGLCPDCVKDYFPGIEPPSKPSSPPDLPQ